MYSMKIQKKIYSFVFVLICTSDILHVVSRKKYFQTGGISTIFSKRNRTVFVERGQEARLRWDFKTNKNIKFNGISWEFFDPFDNKRRRLIWMGSGENRFQSQFAKNRTLEGAVEYKVHLEGQATLVIPNVQIQHQNRYICIVPRTGIDDIYSEVRLIVTEKTTMPSMMTTIPTNGTVPSKVPSKIPETTMSPIFNISSPRYNVTKWTSDFLSNTTHELSESKLASNIKKIGIYVIPGLFALIIVIISIFGFKKCYGRFNNKRSHYQRHDGAGISSINDLQETFEFDVNSSEITDRSWSPDRISMWTGFSYEDSSGEYDPSNYPSPYIDASTDTFFRPFAAPTQPTQLPIQTIPNITNINALQSIDAPLLLPRQNFEIDRGLIRNLKRIGEGAFGLVAKADLLEENSTGCVEKRITVAVKMLKAYASPDDRKDLISEFNLMRRIDCHKNVVKLLGCIMHSEPIWVITEYVCHGDLLGFLRNSRGIKDQIYSENKTTSRTRLTQSQLLKMARDVASGMCHLSRNQIIHRDLAARNVLVGENFQCKITDFGMARDVKSTNYYKKKSRGRIPLKWTAIEALVDEKYTIASDVWSFGVLLYEIVTIGGQPYPGWGARYIIKKLKEGWRMEKPPHVDLQLYRIMKQCWATCPDHRPTFSALKRTFSKLCGGDSDYINMKDYDETLYGNAEDSPENSLTSSNEAVV